jgi:flagellar hook protein FlgE
MPLNSMADALSGLQANQEFMNVVGNNIANVNTVAYKTQNIVFSDLLSQNLGFGSTSTAGGLEGTNPTQIGLGVGMGATEMVNTQGSVQDTGRLTDMAIQGGGYFVVNNGQTNLFTRDGSFNVAPDGTLESGSTGMTVQGWMQLNADGTVNSTAPMSSIKIPLNSQNAGATTGITLAGNLDASQAVFAAGTPPTGGQFSTTITVYDSQGTAHQLDATFQKTATNTWSYSVASPTGNTDITNITGNTGSLTFDANGALTSPTTQPTLAITYANGTAAGAVTLDMSKVSQLAENSQVNVATVDGTSGGTLSTFSVANNGTITAVYSNGNTKVIGQMALADFRNPDGLIRQGNNLYATGINSGQPQYGQAGVGTLGTIDTGQLEGSNVDLAAQFAQMIQAQQGFNANTKVVTTTNNMLQAVISIMP